MSYDPVGEKLEILSCINELDEQEGCMHRRRMTCSIEDASMMLDMKVAFRAGRGWRGVATVEVGGASSCQGEYAIAL